MLIPTSSVIARLKYNIEDFTIKLEEFYTNVTQFMLTRKRLAHSKEFWNSSYVNLITLTQPKTIFDFTYSFMTQSLYFIPHVPPLGMDLDPP